MSAETTSPVDTRAARRAQGQLPITSIDREASGRAVLRGASEAVVDLTATAAP